MEIRPATIRDIDDIFFVRTSVKENHLSQAQLAELGITKESTQRAIEHDEMRIWCAFINEQLVGFASAKAGEANELFALFVLPEFEGRGVGSALHDLAVCWLQDQSPGKSLHLNTEETAKAFNFYQKRGWLKIHGEPTEAMLAGDVLMQLSPQGR